MPRQPKPSSAQISLLEVATKTAPCVPAIRDAVRGWVGGGYRGATATTRTLLNHWFRADHRLPNGEKFQYYPFQREAIETLIYLYEVARVRRHAEMIEAFAKAATAQGGQLRLLQYDDFPRYCLKMATGSGKTKVISLAIAWQYFNALLENEAEYAKTSLIIAPNVIVFERLKLDFGGSRIFRADPKGSLFTWTVFDYPLKQAILDNVTKRPIKGVAQGIKEAPSDIASVRYQAYLTAGVERWREYRDQLAPLKRKPVLFVMLNSTHDADDVADYLRAKYPAEFAADKLLVIHTDRGGDVAKGDLDAARKAAQEIDYGNNPINAIVSVLMLREGWDVQGVTVVVGLRPYSAKANILPEQTIGRGLRLMFRGKPGEPTFRERIDVIGNKAFIEFVEQLEHDEEIEFETFDLGVDRVVIEKIHPEPEKLAQDICVPVLSPALARKRTLKEEIEGLDVSRFKTPKLPMKAGDAAALAFTYEGYDIITLEKMIERDYTVPEVQTAQEVISYYAKRIAADLKLPSQFAALAPKVREDIDVKHKDRAAQLWCENASLLTGTPWEYVIVHQKEFEKVAAVSNRRTRGRKKWQKPTTIHSASIWPAPASARVSVALNPCSRRSRPTWDWMLKRRCVWPRPSAAGWAAPGGPAAR